MESSKDIVGKGTSKKGGERSPSVAGLLGEPMTKKRCPSIPLAGEKNQGTFHVTLIWGKGTRPARGCPDK